MRCRVPVRESFEHPQCEATLLTNRLHTPVIQAWCFGGGRTQPVNATDYDEEKIEDAVLALLYLTMWDDRRQTRAWKGHDWAAMDRLHQKGYIGDPKGKARSVVVTEEGRARAEELFRLLFGKAR